MKGALGRRGLVCVCVCVCANPSVFKEGRAELLCFLLYFRFVTFRQRGVCTKWLNSCVNLICRRQYNRSVILVFDKHDVVLT